jgi:sterol desaturase/sphingolipid hydroxylase (fatty acid hydroxylase superfamily)
LDLKLDYILVLLAFYVLVAWTFLHKPKRQMALRRSWGEWLLDVTGLCIHGLLVPAVRTFVIFAGLRFLLPQLSDSLLLPNWFGFLLAFIGVDYVYYWNHRMLHSPWFWRWHYVHHSSESMDVFATSRNSFFTSFFIVYLWINGLMLFLLQDKEGYIIGVALTNFLDIVRHSGIPRWPNFAPFTWIISPKEHAWHHSSDTFDINFSGNWNLWDRLHGTRVEREKFPEHMGFSFEKKNLFSLFWKGHS